MMSLIKRSYKYRMYPNKTQEELLAKTFGCVRVVWNACVDSFNSYDKETNPNPKFPTKSDLVIEKPWLNEVSAATLQQKQRDFIEFSRQYFNKNRKAMGTLGSHYGGYTYVKVGDRQTDVKIDWQLLGAIEKGEVEIDNEKYHLSGIEYVAKRYQDMFYAGRDIYYFKGIGGHGMTDLLRNAIDDLLDTINSKETYRSAEHRVYAQMNKLTEAGAMISLAIELLTSNIRHSYGEINFERYPRPVEVEGEDKH